MTTASPRSRHRGSSGLEPVTLSDPVANVSATFAAAAGLEPIGSARFVLSIEHTVELPPFPTRRGGALRPVMNAGTAAGKLLSRLATRKFDWRHQEAEGIVDFAARRYMLNFGDYAHLYSDGILHEGRSGRALSTLPGVPEDIPTPLWLLDILAGVTEARDDGPDEVLASPCRRFTASSDLSRASRAIPGGVAVPALGRFEDLFAVPVEVWIDETHVRRVRYARKQRTETLDLSGVGAMLDALDWTRFPTFRSPDAVGGRGAVRPVRR